MTRFDVDTLNAHARDLAAAFGVRVLWNQTRPENAWAGQREGGAVISVAPIVDETTYAVVLHELGHWCAPLGFVSHEVQGGDHDKLAIDAEDAAWEWARHYALEWTAVMETVAAYAFKTYTDPAPPPPPAAPLRRPVNPHVPAVSVNPDLTAFTKSIKWSK